MNEDAANEVLQHDDSVGSMPSTGPQWPQIFRIGVCLIAVTAALVSSFESSLVWLYRIWVREPDYTHGFLVLPIALAIFWKRWPVAEIQAGTMPIRSWWPGWLLVVGALVVRGICDERGMAWMEAAMLMPVLIGLALTGLGWRIMFRVWPAFAFLVFLYPLPTQINTLLSQPLQSLATTGSCTLLRLTGLWVMPEGNVILVGNEKLEVAAACNGLSMLMSLAATVAAAASLLQIAIWKRVGLLLSIVPIALTSNILRISATAWCYYQFGAKVGSQYVHDWAGWLMMPTALGLVGLELLIASWLVVESEIDRSSDRLGLSLVAGPPMPPVPIKPRPKPGESS